MLDSLAPSAPLLQRTKGEARVRFGAGMPARLLGLRQAGSAKAILPKMHGAAPEIVFLNTSGGLTGGDRLQYELELGEGAHAVATTQTAERAYRASAGRAEIKVDLRLGAGAELFWMPQELILFDGASIARDLRVEMGQGARLLLLESLVFGRGAMGETVSRLHLRDRREVWCEGKRAMLEAIRMDDQDLSRQGAAGLGAYRAVASLSLFDAAAEDRLAPLRLVLDDLRLTGIEARASAWEGRITLRLAAADPDLLRKAIAIATKTLSGRALPRVWPV